MNDSYSNAESQIELSLKSVIQAMRDKQKDGQEQKAFDLLSAGMEDLGIVDLIEFGDSLVRSPHQFVNSFWDLPRVTEANNSLRGGVFEHLVELVLAMRGVSPLYTQVTLSMVPNIAFDLVTFPASVSPGSSPSVTGPEPICISLKTSLRERYKQAELEAAAVRGVYRWAKCYLVTLNSKEAQTVNAKITRREVSFLEPVVAAGTAEFDEFVDMMSKRTMTASPQIATIHSNLATLEIGEQLKSI